MVTRTNHNTIQTIGIYVRVFRTADHAGQIFIPHRPPAAICTKPASRPRKMRLNREPAEKNNRLSRRENCGLITFVQFSTSASYSTRPYSPSLVGAVVFSLWLCLKRSFFHCTEVITKRTHDLTYSDIIVKFPLRDLCEVMD